MPKHVQFNDRILDEQQRIAPSFEFSEFAQMAVRNEIERRRKGAEPDIEALTESVVQRMTAKAQKA